MTLHATKVFLQGLLSQFGVLLFVSTVGYEPFSARPDVVTNNTLNTTNPIILTPAK